MPRKRAGASVTSAIPSVPHTSVSNPLPSRPSTPPPSSRSSKRLKKSFVCPHCDVILQETSYYEHKRRFFDAETGIWDKDPQLLESNPAVGGHLLAQQCDQAFQHARDTLGDLLQAQENLQSTEQVLLQSLCAHSESPPLSRGRDLAECDGDRVSHHIHVVQSSQIPDDDVPFHHASAGVSVSLYVVMPCYCLTVSVRWLYISVAVRLLSCVKSVALHALCQCAHALVSSNGIRSQLTVAILFSDAYRQAPPVPDLPIVASSSVGPADEEIVAAPDPDVHEEILIDETEEVGIADHPLVFDSDAAADIADPSQLSSKVSDLLEQLKDLGMSCSSFTLCVFFVCFSLLFLSLQLCLQLCVLRCLSFLFLPLCVIRCCDYRSATVFPFVYRHLCPAVRSYLYFSAGDRDQSERTQQLVHGASFGVKLLVTTWARVSALSVKNIEHGLCLFKLAGHKSPIRLSDHLGTKPASLLKEVNCKLSGAYMDYILCPQCNASYHKDKLRPTLSRLGRVLSYPSCACGHTLFKKTDRGKWKPLKRFYYQSLKYILQQMFLRGDSFTKALDHWRHAPPLPNGCMKDIYDGRLWKELCDVNGPLHQPGNIAVIINYDDFSPCVSQYSRYSCGALYITIANLHRKYRYKRQNSLLCAIVPGPKQNSVNLNAILSPLVQELNEMFDGWDFRMQDGSVRRVRVCCHSIVSDLPAAKKLTQFGHHACNMACSRCYKRKVAPIYVRKQVTVVNKQGVEQNKEVSELVESANWSGLESSEKRSHDRAVTEQKEWKECDNNRQREELYQKNGMRYSVWCELKGFDIVRGVTIDEMHGLYLGVVKNFLIQIFERFINPESKKSEKAREINRRVNMIAESVPSCVSQMPNLFCENFGHMKADQFRVFLFVYSLPVFYGIFDDIEGADDVFYTWSCMVAAFSRFTARTLNPAMIEKAHEYYMLFLEA